MRLEPILDPALTIVPTGLKSRDDVLNLIAGLGHQRFRAIPAIALLAAFKDRESKFPTGTPEGVAFPHALLPEIPQSALVAAILRPPVKWSGKVHPPQDVVFGILGNSDSPWEHVRLLARIARIVRGPGALDRLRAAADGKDLHRRLVEEDRLHG
jgi:PTS system nitrogen regulatory IIA component